MASSASSDRSTTDNKQARDPQPTESNPFIAFRHYADQRISSLFHDFFGPFEHDSAYSRRRRVENRPGMSSPSAGGGRRETEETRDTRVWDKSQPSRDLGEMFESLINGHNSKVTADRESKECRREEDTSRRAPWENTFPDRLLKMGMDALPAVLEDLRSAFASDHDRPCEDYCSSMEYVFASSYAPRELEMDQSLGRKLDWRAAFEDLLLVQHDLPLPVRKRCFGPKPYSLQEPYSDWVWSLQRSRLLPSHPNGTGHGDDDDDGDDWEEENDDDCRVRGAPRFDSQHKAQAEAEERAQQTWDDLLCLLGLRADVDGNEQHDRELQRRGPDTELDAYERLIGSDHLPEKKPASSAANDARNSSIIATLTTTERTVLPDGTVTTKVAWKKRFADGREESSETVHTAEGEQQGLDMESRPQPVSKVRVEESPKTKSGSWFWR